MFYDPYGNCLISENFGDVNNKTILIIRILGNDLSSLHSKDQTYNNLKFTFENETDFNKLTNKYKIDYLYILNRIYSKEKLNKLKELLNTHNKKFIEIEFDYNKFYDCFDESNFTIIKKDFDFSKQYRENIKKVHNYLKNFNLYLINNNGSRNFGLKYGKEHNYTWTFVLDSNSYFTNKLFTNIIDNINDNSRYILIPQIRIAEVNLKNDDLIEDKITDDTNDKLINFPSREPQLAFHLESKFKFNEEIPYGSAPKQEMINLITGKKHLNKDIDAYHHYKIEQRPKTDENHQKLSRVIRLDPDNPNNKIHRNQINRQEGLYNLVCEIKNDSNVFTK